MYTQEQYSRLSLLHPLIEDALNYTAERLEEGKPTHSILDNLETLYGLTDEEAHSILRVALRVTKVDERYHPNR